MYEEIILIYSKQIRKEDPGNCRSSKNWNNYAIKL